jgi:formate dehydrogenase major subunit
MEARVEAPSPQSAKEASKTIPTVCGMCYIGCGILVRVEDGVVVNVEGNPDNPQNRCAPAASLAS